MTTIIIGLKIAAISLSILFGAGATYQFTTTKIDTHRYRPVGKIVDIGRCKLHMIDQGVGGPTVVLDAGLGCNALDWSLVQPEIAKFTRVINYDRAGYGWSDISPLARTSENIADELHALLKKAEIPGPYILVGHSFGGINIRLYASKYPEEVAGIVLVDASHECQRELLPEPGGLLINLLDNYTIPLFLTRIGLARFVAHWEDIPPQLALPERYRALKSTTKFVQTVLKEWSAIPESHVQLKEQGGTLGNKPLVVITRGQLLTCENSHKSQEWVDAVNNIWSSLQKNLVTKSSKGKQVIAENSGHMVAFDQPEIIVSVVKDVINEIKGER